MLALIKTNPFSAMNTVLLVAILAVSVSAREEADDARYFAFSNSKELQTDYGRSIGDVVVGISYALDGLSRNINDVDKAVRSNQDAMKDISDAILWSCSS